MAELTWAGPHRFDVRSLPRYSARVDGWVADSDAMGALNVTETVGRFAADVPDGEADASAGAVTAAKAWVASGDATVAAAARAAVNADRRISAEAIWVSPFEGRSSHDTTTLRASGDVRRLAQLVPG